ncbi:collagenase-like protease [Desulfocurvibacter africanus PCS]|uniref:Collagenase-like protease n=1 Tax=Desulfocurvibacter africanus PCS TaxID=1262666 RepID=M5PPQ5_DESAF|nr:peptidase U32 family protein [Desulfocurvibacter africanus]EMG35974.1 collagenase-like protease [Desulfocurvibacter africanus PCS]
MQKSVKYALPELLAPAGNLEKLAAALTYGADAVYLGGPGLNLRAANAHMSWEQVAAAVAQAHAAGARVYYCLNALPMPGDLPHLAEHLERLADMLAGGVDGIIAADPGVMAMSRRRLPHVPLHVSTQASTMNPAAAMAWHDMGASRVNLARELELGDMRSLMRTLRKECPELETEVFVHGAMCLAISGRCLLSAWLTGRSGNQGTCCHPCRFEYKPAPGAALRLEVEEKLRPGETTWEIEEQQDFSMMFAPEDLCLIKYVPALVRLGVAALKIEGRMKSPLYVAQVVDVYRTALDDFGAGRFRPGLYLTELALASTRPMGSGLFLPGARKAGRRARYFDGVPALSSNVLAKVQERLGPDSWRIGCRGRWTSGRRVQAMLPGLRRPELPAYALETGEGGRLEVLNPGLTAVLRCESDLLRPGIFLRAAPE